MQCQGVGKEVERGRVGSEVGSFQGKGAVTSTQSTQRRPSWHREGLPLRPGLLLARGEPGVWPHPRSFPIPVPQVEPQSLWCGVSQIASSCRLDLNLRPQTRANGANLLNPKLNPRINFLYLNQVYDFLLKIKREGSI